MRAAAHQNRLVSDRFPAWLPDWAQAAVDWVLQPIVLTLLISTSVVLFLLSLIGLPLILTRMPTDFFSRPERRRLKLAERKRPFWFVVFRSLKNALGSILLLLGLIMLVVPGQGLVTIFVALFLLDFPGKRRLQRWIISRRVVHRPVNALRRRAGRLPLELPAPR
jgi:hypothetical protein